MVLWCCGAACYCVVRLSPQLAPPPLTDISLRAHSCLLRAAPIMEENSIFLQGNENSGKENCVCQRSFVSLHRQTETETSLKI